MSYKPPVTGRVKSIKSKFENLSTFESLDVSSSCLNHFPEAKPRTAYLFKRSATSIELPIAQKCRDKLNNSRRQVNVSAADIFALKNRNSPSTEVVHEGKSDDDDTLKPLKEIMENVEVRLNRHTADPVKRGSIKRSPAFRVGDKSGKGVLPKSSSVPVIKKESSAQISEFLRRCSTDAEKLQEVGLTDTLKAVLKQPLPTGPPPKKPPRIFIDSPRENRQPTQMFARAAEEEKMIRSMLAPAELQNKINFLENELVLRPNGRASVHGSPSKQKPFSSNFLKCIPCSSTPVYDTMTISKRKSELAQMPRMSQHRIETQSSSPSSSKLITQSLDKPKRNVSEHIYMEPFAHLRLTKLNNNNDTSNNNNHHHHHHQRHHSSSSKSRASDSNSVGNVKRTSTSVLTPNASVESIKFTSAPSQHNGFSMDNGSIDSSYMSCTSCAADDHLLSDSGGDIHYMVSVSKSIHTLAHGILGNCCANQFCKTRTNSSIVTMYRAESCFGLRS